MKIIGPKFELEKYRKIHLILMGLCLLFCLLVAGCRTGSKRTNPPVKAAPSEIASIEGQTPNRSQQPDMDRYEGHSRITENPELEVNYDLLYDKEIEEIFSLAETDNWEQAEAKAAALYQQSPRDGSIQRLYSWVKKQTELRRSQAVENRIRKIDANNSVFNPTIPGLLTDQKDRGLPPRKDLRDAIDQIQSSPYVPESYGKTIQRSGPMFDMYTDKGRMAKVLQQEVSIRLDNVPLEDIIFKVGQSEGINFVADKSLPAFKNTLSVNMEKVKLDEFLKYVSRNLGLQFQVGDELVWIVDGNDKDKVFEETRFYKLKKGFIMPAQFGATEVQTQRVENKGVVTITQSEKMERFVQDGAPRTPSIERAIETFFTGSKYMIDYERNIIVATGTVDQLAMIEQIIEAFDKPLQQVLIEARFVTVTESAFMELGALWETGRSQVTTRSPVESVFGFETGLGLEETFRDILGRDDLSVTLSALEQSGESQTLSAPRITLVNNLPARINDGKVQYYYEEYTVSQTVVDRATASDLVPSGKPTTITSGVALDVMASIGGDGESILLALRPEVNTDVEITTFATVTDRNTDGQVISSFDIKLPESRTQSLETRVIVKSGQTVVMGGVLERKQVTFVESVPVLGNLPLIGPLFRKRTELDTPRYLLVFVTATLLSDSGEFIEYQTRSEE